MRIRAIKTEKITVNGCKLTELLDKSLDSLEQGSVVAISSKVAGLCEGRAVPLNKARKDDLIRQESKLYLPSNLSRYGTSFSITNNLLVPMAGIDESNADGNYSLWPKDPQATVNAIRTYLSERFGLQDVGVILTDSCVRPLRWGVTGIAVAASGFEAVENDIGKADLFGRPLECTKTSIQDGLAAAAALVMGEADQQTPIAVIDDLPFVTFTRRNPNAKELAEQIIEPEDDLYAPMLTSVKWLKGEKF